MKARGIYAKSYSVEFMREDIQKSYMPDISTALSVEDYERVIDK